MFSMKFFNHSQASSSFDNQPVEPIYSGQVIKHDDISHILSHAQAGSLVILDLDDTVGRVSQTMGLDAWFRFRLQTFQDEGLPFSAALASAVILYNLSQLHSQQMVFVDKNHNMAVLIQQLKDKHVTVIALTARNHEIADKTLELLKNLGVSFSEGVLKNGSFEFKNKHIEIKEGIIFSDGSHKGECLEQLIELEYFLINFFSIKDVSFVDDSERNCKAVAETFTKLKLATAKVWHYVYAELHHTYTESDHQRAQIQERHLLEHKVLLTDDAADEIIKSAQLAM